MERRRAETGLDPDEAPARSAGLGLQRLKITTVVHFDPRLVWAPRFRLKLFGAGVCAGADFVEAHAHLGCDVGFVGGRKYLSREPQGSIIGWDGRPADRGISWEVGDGNDHSAARALLPFPI